MSFGIDGAGRCSHRRIEFQNGLRRLLLVPKRDREHTARRQGPHVGFHRLLRVGELLDDGEAAGIRETDRVGKAKIDNVEALARMGEEVAALGVDHPHLRQNIAGELAEHIAVECLEHGAVALGHSDVPGAGMERDLCRDAAAELRDENPRLLLDEIGVDHRQETEIGRLLVGEVAHDADRAVAVDIKAKIGVCRHCRQAETGIVGKARREMQVGAGIGLQIAERRGALVDFLRVRKFARVSHAFVVIDGERLEPESGRDPEMTSKSENPYRKVG